jgi:hypothetical protein
VGEGGGRREHRLCRRANVRGRGEGGGQGDAHGHGRHAKEQQQSNHVALVDRPRVKLVFSKDLVLLRGGGAQKGGSGERKGFGCVRRGAEGQCGAWAAGAAQKETRRTLRAACHPGAPPAPATNLHPVVLVRLHVRVLGAAGSGGYGGVAWGVVGQCQRTRACGKRAVVLTHLAHRRGAPEAMLVEGARAPAAARRCVAAEKVRQDAIFCAAPRPRRKKTKLFF